MDFDGARMRYLRAGSGPVLILMHGLLGYSFSWRFTLPALAPYATVYAPDLLGAGFSDRPRGIDHSMHATALRVLRFIENLRLENLGLGNPGLESFDLLGTSHGGAVAIMVAAVSAERNAEDHVQQEKGEEDACDAKRSPAEPFFHRQPFQRSPGTHGRDVTEHKSDKLRL